MNDIEWRVAHECPYSGKPDGWEGCINGRRILYINIDYPKYYINVNCEDDELEELYKLGKKFFNKRYHTLTDAKKAGQEFIDKHAKAIEITINQSYINIKELTSAFACHIQASIENLIAFGYEWIVTSPSGKVYVTKHEPTAEENNGWVTIHDYSDYKEVFDYKQQIHNWRDSKRYIGKSKIIEIKGNQIVKQFSNVIQEFIEHNHFGYNNARQVICSYSTSDIIFKNGIKMLNIDDNKKYKLVFDSDGKLIELK